MKNHANLCIIPVLAFMLQNHMRVYAWFGFSH